MIAPALATARLRLRAITAGDLALFLALYTDAETMRYIGRPRTPIQVKARLRETLDAAKTPRGPWFFAIVEKRVGTGVGLCSLRRYSAPNRSIEAGFMLVRQACGRGYAREAFGALIAAAFRVLPVDTVWVQYRSANAAVIRLFEALGFSEADGWRPRGAGARLCVSILRRPNERDPSHQPTRGKAMSNIIGFLEDAGRDAALRHATREQLLLAMRHAEVSPALLQPGRSAIESLLGVRETMYCDNQKITPPKKAPPKKKPVEAPPKKMPAKKPTKKVPGKR